MNKVNDPVVTKSMLDNAVEALAGIIGNFANQVDQRFNKIERDMIDLKGSHDRLLNTIDGFISRIDAYETENTARDAHIARLERWIEQIAKETGVNLKGSL